MAEIVHIEPDLDTATEKPRYSRLLVAPVRPEWRVNDDTGALYRTRDRRIFVQGPMRSETIAIVERRISGPGANVPRHDDYVIHTLAPDRSDKPFGKAILPR